jgi:photosystem II stability/assembly factor-like uncharacterized protein
MNGDMKRTPRGVSTTVGLIIVLASLVLDVDALWAGINEWTSLAWPEGGRIGRLISDPGDSSTLYATNIGDPGRRGYGIFKSTDGGLNWRALTVRNSTTSVTALAVSAQEPRTLYAGTPGQGVFKSIDAGESWAATGLTEIFAYTLAVDPKTPSIVFAFGGLNSPQFFGTYWTIYKSTDGGMSWVDLGLPGPRAWGIQVLAIDPRDSNTVYAGDGGCCSDGGLYKSTDGGSTWIEAPSMQGCLIVDILFSSQDADTLYAGASCLDALIGNVFKSTDAGATWSSVVGTGLPETRSNIWSLAGDPAHSQIMYAGFSRGVFRTVDGGASWSPFNNGLRSLDVGSLALARATSNILYAITRDGLFTTTDASLLATNVKLNPTSVRLGSSFTATLSGKNLTAATYFDVRFRRPGNSADQELNWQQGLFSTHGVATDTAAGIWTITGLRAHQEADDHTSDYVLVSATVTVNPMLVTGIRLDPATVRPGGSFTATFSGTNLTNETYFDVRFRSPGSNTDQVALNWQKGTSATHNLSVDTATGTWFVTGVWAHASANDHSSDFAPVSALLMTNP